MASQPPRRTGARPRGEAASGAFLLCQMSCLSLSQDAMDAVTSTALTIVPATNTANTVRLRKYKKMEYSNYNCQSKENRNLSKPAETRRRRPSSYIGTSHSPRPYTRKTEQMLTSPSLLGQNTSLSFNIQINLIEFGLRTHASFWSLILLNAFIST